MRLMFMLECRGPLLAPLSNARHGQIRARQPKVDQINGVAAAPQLLQPARKRTGGQGGLESEINPRCCQDVQTFELVRILNSGFRQSGP